MSVRPSHVIGPGLRVLASGTTSVASHGAAPDPCGAGGCWCCRLDQTVGVFGKAMPLTNSAAGPVLDAEPGTGSPYWTAPYWTSSSWTSPFWTSFSVTSLSTTGPSAGVLLVTALSSTGPLVNV